MLAGIKCAFVSRECVTTEPHVPSHSYLIAYLFGLLHLHYNSLLLNMHAPFGILVLIYHPFYICLFAS